MSCGLFCFNCLVFFGCRDKIINHYAFYPPKPSYDFKQIDNSEESNNDK